MSRSIRSAEAIQQMVQERINHIEEIEDDGAEVRVPMPTRNRVVDRDGCNWDMSVFGNATAYIDEIRLQVETVRSQFNLE
jgi:hypothetical protein